MRALAPPLHTPSTSRQRRRRASPPAAQRGSDEPDADAIRRLEALLLQSVAVAPVEAPPRAAGSSPLPHVLPRLPLWRVAWAALPGFREVLHVHEPGATQLFTQARAGAGQYKARVLSRAQLLAGPRPWRYAQLYTPDPSDDEATPVPSARAASLCEVFAAERTADGRLFLAVRTLGRLAVQSEGVGTAECALAPDTEETAAWSGESAASAAAAWGLTWQTYYESCTAGALVRDMPSRTVAIARSLFELPPPGDPPAAPPAAVAAAALAAGRAAAAAQGRSGATFDAMMPADAAAAEAALWAEYDAVTALQGQLTRPPSAAAAFSPAGLSRAERGRPPKPRPPYAARALRPLAPPGAESAISTLRPDAKGAPEWPRLRAFARATYGIAACLPELGRGAGRQRLLDCTGCVARAGVLTEALGERRATLAAVLALERYEDT